MFHFLMKTRTALGAVLPALVLVLAACGPTLAQTQYSDVPVLVAAEDENKSSIRRGSEIFKRIIGQIQEATYRTGFRVVDEESVAADREWKIKDRQPKRHLVELAKRMNRTGVGSHQVRALFLFRVFAVAKPGGGGSWTDVKIRINGEILDIVGNKNLGDFEIADRKYDAPADCLKPEQKGLCITEVVGKHARELGADLGLVLSTRLEHLRKVSVGGGQTRRGTSGDSGEAVTGDARGTRRGGSSGHGIQTPYTITLRYFDRREALTIIGVMADEFPGYNTHTLLNTNQATRRYSYITSAKPHKMEEWLTILLGDMNFNVDKQVRIAINGTDITVEKIVPTDDRPRSTDERARFK